MRPLPAMVPSRDPGISGVKRTSPINRTCNYRVENFVCTSGLSFCPCLFDAPEILLRAIDLQINAVEKLYGNSLWTRTLEGMKDANMVLKVFWNISRLCDVFQVSFSHHWPLAGCPCNRLIYWLRHTKINTWLHTKVKVEEIFKVIYLSSSYEYFFRF